VSGSNAAPEWTWVPAASAIAREAGALLRKFFSGGVETEYKGDADLVTVADRTAEKLIRERLSEAFPDHGIYGEEGTRDRLEGEFRWYVDPLDGTTNFARMRTVRWWPRSSTIPCGTSSLPPSGEGARG
jgi:myo-inositol-1(or 4)-monophosphatase